MSAPVLIVEDDITLQQMLSTLLGRKLGYESVIAEHGRRAIDILEKDTQQNIKLVLLDFHMPVMDGLETLKILRQRYPTMPIIMLTGSKEIELVVDCMKHGATDFLTKPYEGERLLVTVKNAMKLATLSKEVSRLKSEKEGRFSFDDLIGHDTGLASVVRIGRKAAAADIPVLITGETGVGKEVFAKAIHGESTRAGKSFIAVNCGAIPSQLVESTLFGHEKGAFTGATEKAIGKFREAEGGTIFLDEVGELPLDTQVKLLRVLQQKEVEPVGASKSVPVNVRIVSATNRDLQDEVDKGRFREDLYFRLNVLQVELPPLRMRTTDIPLLIHHFVERFCANENKTYKDVSKDALTALMKFDWPGNIRQLENTVKRALVLNDSGQLETADFSALLNGQDSTTPPTPFENAPTGTSINLMSNGSFKTMEEIEFEAMEKTLAHFQDNTTKAAEALGIAKSTFYRKMASKTD